MTKNFMNLYRFLLHSSWVAIAITIFFPASARSEENSRPSWLQQQRAILNHNKSKLLAQASGSAADLIVSPRGLSTQTNGVFSTQPVIKSPSPPTPLAQVHSSETSGRSMEFVRPDSDDTNNSEQNIYKYIRNDTTPSKNLPKHSDSQLPNYPPEGIPPQSPASGFPQPSINSDPGKTSPAVIPVKNQSPEHPPTPHPPKTELQSLTLEQALEIAKQNNPEFQSALLRVKRSQAVLREAQAEWYPKVNINGVIENTRSASDQLAVEKGVAPPNTDEAVTQFTGQAELRYSIFTSGRRSATVREAEERLRVDKLDVEAKYQTLRLNTTLRYYDLQAADEQVRISKSAVENAQASLRDAQALEQAGVGTRFDVLRSQVNLANAQQDVTNALSQQSIARRRLATLLSLPSNVNIVTAEPVKIAGLWDAPLEPTIIQAFERRSELQQRLAERNIAQQRRRQALSAKGPQVDFVATYDLLDQYNDDISVTDGYSIGVRASLNLYDGGAAKARANQAKTDMAIAETNFASQRDQIRFEVEQFYSQLQSSQENVQTATLALEQAKEALRLARLRFQAGVGTQTDVISAENDLTRAEGNRITAILDYNRAFANLERAVGTVSK
ncbi:TolC family protein [Calothrix sp. NIES-3974]|uniref:TolC family protein n=1 Tax=Calothrix sp. NIES-3974 TaxID=2005462 RepID=UPI000B605460|nr:TolC family protein [Calothrix sp. NIES-3974]BAZ04621.1 outer membrane efflux protein [Calothrix sp. NIES-3974]